MGTAQDPLIVPHPICLGLGPSRVVRAAAWRDWLYVLLNPDEISRTRAYKAQERALGEPCFQAKALNRPPAVKPRGRPIRAKEVEVAMDKLPPSPLFLPFVLVASSYDGLIASPSQKAGWTVSAEPASSLDFT